MQSALDHLYKYSFELFKESEIEKEIKEKGIGADLADIHSQWKQTTEEVFRASNVQPSDTPPAMTKGKQGYHTEHMGYILAQIQFMQRAYPDMQW